MRQGGRHEPVPLSAGRSFAVSQGLDRDSLKLLRHSQFAPLARVAPYAIIFSMRKLFSSIFLLLFVSGLFAEAPSHESRVMAIPVGGGTIYASLYVFNEQSEGGQIAKDVYNFPYFDKIMEGAKFSYLMPIPPGQGIAGWNWAIWKADNEFWIFKNVDDANLYGCGRYIRTDGTKIYRPGKNQPGKGE